MASTIKLKNGSGAPLAGDLVQGEPALDLTNKRLYTEDSGGTVIEVGTNPTSITTGTITASGEITANGGIALGDNDKATFGASDDLQIYHDGSNSFISDTGTGNLNILANEFALYEGNGTDLMIGATPNGAVTLSYNASTKLATTATGIDVTGTVTADGLISNVFGNVLSFNRGDTAVAGVLKYVDATTSFNMGTTTSHDFNLISADTVRLTVDSGGNVGIGTANPSNKFEVYNAGFSSAQISGNSTSETQLRFSGNTAARISNQSNTELIFDTNATERMRIDSSGNVGIGTTSPVVSLDVKSFGNTQIRIGETTGTYYFDIGRDNTDGLFRISGNQGLGYKFLNATTEVMRIDGSGNVGIGTASPSTYSAELAVVADGSTPRIAIVDDATNNRGGYIESNFSDALVIGTTSGVRSIAFKPDNTERMRLDTSGNLLVGKTSTSYTTAGTIIEPAGRYVASYDGGIAGVFARLTSDGDIIQFRKDGTTVGSIGADGGDLFIGTGDTGIRFSDSGNAIVGQNPSTVTDSDAFVDLGTSGIRFKDIYATNATIQTSDRNEKQDIEALSEAEQRVAVACKGLLRKFRWKDAVEEKGDDARIHFGIIAQDLQAAFEAEGLDAGRYGIFIHSTWTDEETGEEHSRMGVRYSELLAFIIAAI